MPRLILSCARYGFFERISELVQCYSNGGTPLSDFNKVEPALPTFAFTDEWLVDVKSRG
jgi:hypothetical protein